MPRSPLVARPEAACLDGILIEVIYSSVRCGRIQTGSFLDGAAPNGLFGLRMTNISVPSTMARQGLISNSFSMCFGADGAGRISFGDKRKIGPRRDPFQSETIGVSASEANSELQIFYDASLLLCGNFLFCSPTYIITATQIIVNGNNAVVEFDAIFDSGTSFTHLNDPAYSSLTNSYNNLVKETRYINTSSDLPFEYCYNIAPAQTEVEIPKLELTMKGGDLFNITNPTLVIKTETNKYIYCLGIVTSGDINIIGQNFMAGHRIIFDRERNILGWKASDCYDTVQTSTLPVSPSLGGYQLFVFTFCWIIFWCSACIRRDGFIMLNKKLPCNK